MGNRFSNGAQRRTQGKRGRFRQSGDDTTLITKAQIGLLHVAKQELKLDDETYRDMLENVASVSSARDLPQSKFDAVLQHLKACGFEIRRKEGTSDRKKYAELDGRPGMATAAQLRFIEVQFIEYVKLRGEPTDDRDVIDFGLRHYLKKFYKVEDVRFLTKKSASDAIEGLKNTLLHERDKLSKQSTGNGISQGGVDVKPNQQEKRQISGEGTGPGTGTGTGQRTGAGTDTGQKTVPGAGAGQRPGAGAGQKTGTGTGPGAGQKPGAGPNIRRVF